MDSASQKLNSPAQKLIFRSGYCSVLHTAPSNQTERGGLFEISGTEKLGYRANHFLPSDEFTTCTPLGERFDTFEGAEAACNAFDLHTCRGATSHKARECGACFPTI